MTARGIRAAAFSFAADPFLVAPERACIWHDDALVVSEDGHISDFGAFADVAPRHAGLAIDHYPGAILSAGFIDTHVHYPQTQMIGAFGEGLLGWLNNYTFVAEQDFADAGHAAKVADVFLRELLRNGTTTAAVYCTVHPQSVDAFFEASEQFNTRMIAGKVLMDRNAPAALCDTPESGYAQSKALLEKWHGRGRQLYCVTPRFAGSSSPEQLARAAQLWREHPGTFMQTHVAENRDEVAWIAALFPESRSYLDVYHRAGLTGRRALFAHGVHLDEADFACCHTTGSALSHCPTSNLFLGSGLFQAFAAKRVDRPVHVGLGTDIGAGTSFSLLQTLNEAYKVSALQDRRLTAWHAFWLATRGGAQALDLDDRIGSLEPGREADIVVLDPAATPAMAFRAPHARNPHETLFMLMTMGDDRAVRATYVAGRKVYDRQAGFTLPPQSGA